MAAVLTTADLLTCPHQAPILVRASQRMLTVDGQPVLVRADLLAATIASCPNIGTGLSPCTRITSITDGLSRTLTVGGQPVALATVTGGTNAVPQPAQWRAASAGQTKLEAA